MRLLNGFNVVLQDLEQLKNMASVAGSRLSSFAQGFMRDLQGGY